MDGVALLSKEGEVIVPRDSVVTSLKSNQITALLDVICDSKVVTSQNGGSQTVYVVKSSDVPSSVEILAK